MAKKTEKDTGNTLESALANIRKDFGANVVVTNGEVPEVRTLSTGIPAIDLLAIGRGGFPRGRITELYGAESSGKTTTALSAIAQAQKNGELCVFIDVERALDFEYVKKIGVNVPDLIYAAPRSGEEAFEIIERLSHTGEVDLIVVDSVSAMLPAAEDEGQIGDANIGLQARMMSQGLRRLTPRLAIADTSVVFINQLREKVGVMFGSPEVTSGGKALKFYAALRVRISKEPIKKSVNGKQHVVGTKSKFKVDKSKIGPAFREVDYEILYDVGINREKSLLQTAVDFGLAEEEKAGYYSVQGVDKKLRPDKLRESPELYDKLRNDLYSLALDGVLPEEYATDQVEGSVDNTKAIIEDAQSSQSDDKQDDGMWG